MKSLFLILAAGLILASCTDKKAADEISKLKADMMKADSICKADNMLLLDSIGKMQMKLDSLMNPPTANTTKSSTSTKTTTTKTTTSSDKGTIMDTKGKSSEPVDMKTKGKTSEPVDMKTKGKTSKSTGGGK